jgi:hypothetical protein
MRKALAPERLGGKCYFNLCAEGETLLFKDLSWLAFMLLKLGHSVSIVTNAIPTKPLKHLIEFCGDFKDMLFIKCSLHYTQLLKKNLLETFFNNIKLVKDARISFGIEIVANDEEIALIPDIQEICMKKLGAYCHVAESRNERIEASPRLTKLPLKEHQNAWNSFNSKLFSFQQKTYENRINEYCYGGEYGLHLNLQTGEYLPCTIWEKLGNIFENIDEPLQFCAVGHNCKREHCWVSYVWLVLCSCYTVDGTEDFRYIDFRDRVCEDGSHWLTPAMQEAFSHRCSEYHVPYGEDKALYIDLLMRKVFSNKDPYDHEMADLARIIGNKLAKHGIKKIAIYGESILNQWFQSILAIAGIEIMASSNIDTSFCDVDLIVVTEYGEFTRLAPLLRSRNSATVVSIIGLVDL